MQCGVLRRAALCTSDAHGFSAKTCLPASSAARMTGAWVGVGVLTITQSTDSSLSAWLRSDVTRAPGALSL